MRRGLVLVVGPDGAGKTTLLDEVERQLGAPLQRAHSRPGLIAGRPSDGAPVVDPHAQQARAILPSLAKLAVVFADTVAGSLLRWRPQARERIVVVERGWYDLAVDPLRYRLPDSFSPLIAALGWLVPRADVVLLLGGEPEELHRRKPEIGVVEVARQLTAWNRYAPRAGQRVVRLDTVGQPVETCAAQVISQLPAHDRWYRVPVAPRRLDLRATGASPAVAIYRPHAPRVRNLVAANAPLLRAGIAARAAPPPIPHLDALLERMDDDVEHVAAFRSSLAGRWVIGAADRRRLHTVLKVGAADDAGLAAEQAALETLTCAPGIEIPRLLWADRTDRWFGIATAALQQRGSEPGLEAVAQLCTRMVRGDLGVPMVHGDLAPWNMAMTSKGIALWDFEEAKLGVSAPLFDLTHFVVSGATLLGRWGPTAAAQLLTGSGSPGARHLSDLGVAGGRGPELVQTYLQATRTAPNQDLQFRAALATALPG